MNSAPKLVINQYLINQKGGAIHVHRKCTQKAYRKDYTQKEQVSIISDKEFEQHS